VVVPNGFDKRNHPTSISFIGALNGEADILRVAARYQAETNWDKMHPEPFWNDEL